MTGYDLRGRLRGWARLPASLGGRLMCIMLVAASPVFGLALARVHSGYRLAIDQAQMALLRDRDLLASRLSAHIATVAGIGAGLAGAWPEASAHCDRASPIAAPDGIAVDVVCAGQTGATLGSEAAGLDELLSADLLASLTRANSPDILVGRSGRIVLVTPLPATGSQATGSQANGPRPSGQFLVARIGVPVLPGGLLAWLADAAGRSWPLGRPPAQSSEPAPPGAAGVLDTALADGRSVFASRIMLSAQAFLVVARPSAPIRRAAAMVALRHLGEVALMLGFSILVVVLGTRSLVTRPLSRLRRAVAAWRSGGAAFEIPGAHSMPEDLRELAETVRAGATALAARERELALAIERADLLAAEVHHRVKNNLQIVSSLLALQAQRVTDNQARAEFEAARDRIGALATLHRHMYAHHDPEAIDLSAFIKELGAQLFASIGDKPGRRIALDVAAPALRISSDQAVPLALIITEAVSAALKQGFPPGQGGRISIRVAAEGGRATLAIEDDGVGARQDDQLRALLLRGLARQLGAELQRQESRLALDFPLRPTAIRQPPALRPKSPDPKPDPDPGPAPPAPSSPA